MSVITYEDGTKAFDLRVDIFDHKTGQVVKRQPYKKHVKKGGDYDEWYERDGIRYLANGECLDPKKLAAKGASTENEKPAPAKKLDLDKELS